MKHFKFLVLILAILNISESSASLITISFDGKANGQDDFGYFGDKYQNYFDTDISVLVTYDTDKAPTVDLADSDLNGWYEEEGNFDWLNVSFTFNGIAFADFSTDVTNFSSHYLYDSEDPGVLTESVRFNKSMTNGVIPDGQPDPEPNIHTNFATSRSVSFRIDTLGGDLIDSDEFFTGFAGEEFLKLPKDYPGTNLSFRFFNQEISPNGTNSGKREISEVYLTDFSNLQIKSVEAPEPSTLAIFALGMIGLASRRFKKQH